MSKIPLSTICPTCGHIEPSIVCHICKTDKLPDIPMLRLKTARRPWYTEDTSAEDARLDDPRHEPGSNR